jgi:hypothetical protein
MRIALIAASSLLALPALAQQPGVAGPGAQPVGPDDIKVNQLIIYGDDTCPQSADPNEVIVCARLPEDDRYRIPPNLRHDPNAPANQSWANRAIELQYVGRSGTDSCSPTGPGGFTGCFVQLANQGRAERRSNDQVNWARLIEEARQERLSRIDAAAEEEEAEVRRREAEAANRPD